MAKNKSKKTKSKKSGSGFFSQLFDLFTAILILAIAGAAVWFFVFYDNGGKKDAGMHIEELKNKPAEVKKEPVFDPGADEVEQDRIDGEYFDGEDEMSSQFEEFTSNFEGGFGSSVRKWASKYEGLKLKEGADPDKDKASDNSHLICAIWRNSASENNITFTGYMNSEAILKNVTKINRNDARDGDLIVLKNGMLGMITDFVSHDDFKLIYASGSKGSVIKSGYGDIKNYWLKEENLKGYYRADKDILN